MRSNKRAEETCEVANVCAFAGIATKHATPNVRLKTDAVRKKFLKTKVNTIPRLKFVQGREHAISGFSPDKSCLQ